MKYIALCCIASFVLLGCVKTISVWEKPNTTPEQEKQDLASCVYEANKNSQEGVLSNNAKNERIKKLRDLCLEAKGYKLISRKQKSGY